MRRSLPEIALHRPITVTMLIICMLGLGTIAWYRLPIEFIPKLDVPFIGCWIPYLGATPEQVENEIAIPAEGEFRTISGLRRITTTSNSGGCFVHMRFEWETDMDLASAEVRDRMERLKLKLPQDVERLMLRRFSSNTLPIMAFAVFREGDEEELAHRIRTILRPRLLRIEGVADVPVFGKPEREVVIEFDQNALRSHRLGLYQVVAQLQASSLNVSVGEIEEGRTKYYVRTLGEFSEPEQMGELVVGPNALRLKDVARVSYKAREVDQEFNIDKKGGAFMLVVKEAEANAISTCDAVRDELEAVKQDPLFEGMQTFMFLDQSKIIRSALDGLLGSGKLGGLLAIAVLYLFLRRTLPTIVVALSIPASLTAAFVFMFFTGMTLNIVTMAAMIITVGMLVDNAIVVTENIYRYGQLGHGIEESARRGAGEVALAITSSTLTTVVVFIPVMYLQGGEMSIYMKEFAAPVTVALLGSLLLALTAIPLAMVHVRPSRPLEQHRYLQALVPLRERLARLRNGRLGRALGRFRPFRGLLWFYQASLTWAITSRAAAILLIAGFIAFTYFVPYQRVGVQEMPTVDTRQVEIGVEFGENFDMDRARATFEQLQQVVDRQRETLGIKNIFADYSPEGGSLEVYLLQPEDLPPGATFPRSTEEVRDILWQQMPDQLPGVELHFSVAQAGEGQTGRVGVMMRGDDSESLDQYAERFKVFLRTVPGLSDVETDAERARQEMQVKIDEELAEQAGVSPMVIARSVDFALRGIRLPYMKKEGREIPVWAQFREEDRKTRANLENVAVLDKNGELIPLDRLVTLEKAKSPQEIRRVDSKNVVMIEGKVTGENMAGVRDEILARIEAFDLPPGYSINLGEQLEELDINMTNFITSLILSVVLIYIVMGALFESYVLPLSILTCVPLAFMGVYWAMFLTGTALDTIAFIGCILMVGVVVNNGIIIIDHINQLRKQGLDRREAILQGGHDRLRPVLMTALTTILGCVPLAIGGDVGGEVSFQSLGRALIGGMTTGTFLTLMVVPLAYTLIDDLRIWFLRYFSDLKTLAKRQEPTPDPTAD